jgi:hypothetical protein
MVEHDQGGWRLRCPASEIVLQVPETLRQMIGAQIERLNATEQRVLEGAAIAGMTFTPAIRAPTVNMDPSSFEDCCDALARRNHILRLAGTRELPDGQVVQRYEFVHALYREVLYQRQAPARRAMLHRRGAERMEELFAGSLDDVASELAYHFEQGSDWTRAVKYRRRVAEVAGRQGARERAKANLKHALALTARLPATERLVSGVEVLDALAGIYLATQDEAVMETLTLLRSEPPSTGSSTSRSGPLWTWPTRWRGAAVSCPSRSSIRRFDSVSGNETTCCAPGPASDAWYAVSWRGAGRWRTRTSATRR